MTTRRLNIVLGVWLVLSAMLWPHRPPQFWNAVIAGAFVVTFELLASQVLPRARLGNTFVGGWLLLSSFALPVHTDETFWTHLIVGALVLIVSLRPSPPAVPWSGGVKLWS
jgi:hypothetical protein